MKIWANDEVIPFNLANEKNLGDVISSLLILVNQVNKVVLEVIVDGETLPLEERSKYESRPIEEVSEVKLKIENKLPVALYALEEAKNLLPEFKQNLSEVSELLMAGQKHKAMSLFGNSLLIWRKIINFLRTVAASYYINFNDYKFDGQTIEQKNLELLKVLQEIKQATEKEDIVTLSDLIEYELIGKVEDQEHVINELVTVVKEIDQNLTAEIKTKINTDLAGVS